MSFFDNTKNVGLALILVGIINLIVGIINIALGATSDLDTVPKIGVIVAGVGTIIAGFLYYKYGKNVREGAITQKIEILASYVHLVGYVMLITGIFSLIANVAGGVVSIILGIIIMWCAKKIDDGKETTFDKILWIILVVVFALMTLGGLVSIISLSVVGILLGICNVIIGIFMLLLMLDDDVKKKMGM